MEIKNLGDEIMMFAKRSKNLFEVEQNNLRDEKRLIEKKKNS